jgi:hypothetical protein
MHDDNSPRVDEDCHSTEQELLYKLVRSNLFVRNTKESAGREYDVPEVCINLNSDGMHFVSDLKSSKSLSYEIKCVALAVCSTWRS